VAGFPSTLRGRRRVSVTLQVLLVGVVAVAVWVYVSRLVVFPPWHHTFDLRVYRGAVQWWLDGRPLYAFVRPNTSKGFTYPPFGALALMPLAIGTETTATVLSTAASAVLLIGTTWLLVAPVARRHGWTPWFSVAVSVPLVFALEPVRETFGWGQVNLWVVAFVLADVVALQRGWAWAGVGMGLAAAIKVTPGLFLVYLLLTRRWRNAAVAVGTFLAATLLAVAPDPRSSVQFWTDTLWQTGRVGRVDRTSNQSLLGLLARLADPRSPDRRLWLVLAGAVLVLALWRAVQAFRRGDELVGVTITGLATCLISPISWTHHLYWVVPAAVVLVDVAAGTPVHASGLPWLRTHPRAVARGAGLAALAVVAAFLLSVIWFFEHVPGAHGSGGVLGILGENAYVVILVALVALIPARSLPADPQSRLSPAAPSAARRTAPPRPGGSSPR
jgi:alpha-1,2-mannosyltransferase